MASYHSNSAIAYALAVVYQSSPWYTVSDLLTLYAQLANTDLASPTSRFDTLTLLTGLVSTVPYTIPDGSPTRPVALRFSSATPASPPLFSAFYVCRDYAVWHELFNGLVLVLSTPPAPPGTFDPTVSLFYETLDGIQHAIDGAQGVFNYLSFEASFYLQWR